MIYQQGVYRIPHDDYHGDPCIDPSLSRGTLVDMLDAPARAWFNHPRLNPDRPKEKDRSKFDIGLAGHDLLLEGGKNIFLVGGFDDWKKVAAREAREAAYRVGMIPLLQKEFDNVSAMAESGKRQVRECLDIDIADMESDGDAELTYIWQESNGVWCRVRPDWISKDRKHILDYKTTATSAAPDHFARHIKKMEYPVQSSFYKRGVKAVEGVTPKFTFMAQENEPPYLCSFFSINSFEAEIADDKVEVGIRLWKWCTDRNDWPGYTRKVCWVDADKWEYDEWQSKKYQLAWGE